MTTTTDSTHEFWTTGHRYEDLARTYEQHITITHPDSVSSDRLSPYCYFDTYNTTTVSYYEYRGPNIQNI